MNSLTYIDQEARLIGRHRPRDKAHGRHRPRGKAHLGDIGQETRLNLGDIGQETRLMGDTGQETRLIGRLTVQKFITFKSF